MRCTRERSGAAVGLVGDSLTGDMGGDYTSCEEAIKIKRPNSTRPQAELEHCRGWFRQYPKFAGGFCGRLKMFTLRTLHARGCGPYGSERAPRRRYLREVLTVQN